MFFMPIQNKKNKKIKYVNFYNKINLFKFLIYQLNIKNIRLYFTNIMLINYIKIFLK